MAPLDMPLKEASIVLAKMGFDPWLEAHGKMRRKDLTKKQEIELKECFELIDSGGSGMISTYDMPLAFDVLGMNVTKQEIDEAVREVCANKKTMEYPKFRRVILLKFDKLPVDEYAPSDSGRQASSEYTLPFSFLAQAYRRKKLIEAVMGGDKALQDRMNLRSERAFKERLALREETEKPVKTPKKKGSMTLEPSEREKRREIMAASLKKHPKPKPDLPEPALPSYLLENVSPDVAELLLGEKRKDIMKAVLDSEVKFVPPTNKSVEIDQSFSGRGGEILSKAYLKEKLERFRSDIRHKPTMRKQVIRVQALKSLRDYYQKGSMQVKGSPLLHAAARRSTVF
ncbi:hypothetical protein KC19_10G030400 [Ceratodon purpureus]|uniref:EF-hand domain-containing protein n=2 Tax=Ceratodon purpureus TaxID=3225 RepID=A0A8T0GGA3_CERPU|nr:hypothetical protein KC19_10G030400 [Ceratodon purpureus]